LASSRIGRRRRAAADFLVSLDIFLQSLLYDLGFVLPDILEKLFT
jgi:hypothetical protein